MPTKYKGTKEEEAALNAFINFMRAGLSINSRLHGKYLEYGLTESQFGVLSTIYFNSSPLNQKEIASRLLTTAGNMTMVIDNLEIRGLVKRTREKKDRRVIRIGLTEKGTNLISEIFPKHVKAIVKEMSVLTLQEQQTLRELCRKLGKGIEKTNSEGKNYD